MRNGRGHFDDQPQLSRMQLKRVPNQVTPVERRPFLQLVSASVPVLMAGKPSQAATPTGPQDGNLKNLPADAVKSYLKYRIPLQTAVNFYVFDLQEQIQNVDTWNNVGEIFRVSSSRMIETSFKVKCT